MLYRLRSGWAQNRFYRQTADILDTAPMPVVDAPWTMISMLTSSYVQMYILAMKSFYLRIKRGKIVVIVDRDMPASARQTLERHFPGIRFAILEDIDTGLCQRGGTWERLLYILDHSYDEYAIQLDADTLTFGPDINEVIHCVENNISFTLGNGGQPIQPMLSMVPIARAREGNYIGVVVERRFDEYPGAQNLKYVQASSGFCGFARGGISRKEIETFHTEGEKLLGKRWRDWGTEQLASNFAIANSANAVVLPYPKYDNFGPGFRGGASFLHFIGAFRYNDDHFAKLAKGVISDLNICSAKRH